MKKIIFLLFVISGFSFADGFYCAGAFDYDINNTIEYAEPDNYKTEITIGYEWKLFYGEFETLTDVTKAANVSFSPYNVEYYARAGVRYNMLYCEYEHLCMHGIDTYNPRGGYNRLTIGFDTRYAKNKDARARLH